MKIKPVAATGFAPDLRRAINQLIKKVESQTPRSNAQTHIDQTPEGFFIRPAASDSLNGTDTEGRWL